MKEIWAIVVLIFWSNAILPQTNLVPNPSFEIHVSCPPGTSSNYYEPFPWFNPTINTPDYYNQCNNSLNGQAGVPCNWTGCQNARTGVAYSGGAFYYSSANAREYIEVRLTEQLKAGKQYCVEFWVSLAGRSNFSLDRIGAYLSQDSVYSGSPFILPYQPQIENPQGNTISDTTNWVSVSGLFLASGGEKFITIGNFYPDSLTQIDSIYPFPGIWSYYYIDDVSVICCDVNNCEDLPLIPLEEDIFIPTAFSPNADGNNDYFQILTNYPDSLFEEVILEVFDRWGEKVYSWTGPPVRPVRGWDGTYKGQALNTAVFVYYARLKLKTGEIVSKKGSLLLMR